MFKIDDYIVVLKDTAKINNWQGYVFKQKYQCAEIRPSILIDGKENHSYCYSDYSDKKYWRYATPEEIAEYDRQGKPFDVTKLPQEVVVNDYNYLIKLFEKWNIK